MVTILTYYWSRRVCVCVCEYVLEYEYAFEWIVGFKRIINQLCSLCNTSYISLRTNVFVFLSAVISNERCEVGSFNILRTCRLKTHLNLVAEYFDKFDLEIWRKKINCFCFLSVHLHKYYISIYILITIKIPFKLDFDCFFIISS